MNQLNQFVFVKIGKRPEGGHVIPIRAAFGIRRKMGRSTGSEPATSGTTNRRSNQLSYDRHNRHAGLICRLARGRASCTAERIWKEKFTCHVLPPCQEHKPGYRSQP